MAKERFIGAGAKSVPDAGLPAMKARLAAQRADQAKGPVAKTEPDDALLAMRHRVKGQKDEARQSHADHDKATAAAAKKHLSSTKKSTTTGD